MNYTLGGRGSLVGWGTIRKVIATVLALSKLWWARNHVKSVAEVFIQQSSRKMVICIHLEEANMVSSFVVCRGVCSQIALEKQIRLYLHFPFFFLTNDRSVGTQ